MADFPHEGNAAMPEDAAFDGDATTAAMPAGVTPGGDEPTPDDDGEPPIDGGVTGATSTTALPGTSETGQTVDADRQGELPPEEHGR